MEADDDTAVSLGRRFAAAVGSKDAADLERILSPDVAFRGLTPGRTWEANSTAEVQDVIFGHWFADDDHIEKLVSVDTAAVEDRNRLAYRVLVRNPDGAFVVEQQAYYDVEGSRISRIHVLCSGYRRTSGAISGEVRPG